MDANGCVSGGKMTTEADIPLTTAQQMISSGSGALLVSLFTTPFDVVKVRLQAQLKCNTTPRVSPFLNLSERVICTCFQRTHSYQSGLSYRHLHRTIHGAPYSSVVPCILHQRPRATPKFTSSRDALLKIAQYEGIPRLWRGLSPTLVMMVPQTVVYFTAYDKLKMRLGYRDGESCLFIPLLSGVLARVFAVAAISPIEMVRTKLQSRRSFRYSEILSVLRTGVRTEGAASLWRGMGPTLLRDVPFSALYWVSYEYVKSRNPDPSFATTFVGGAVSGTFAAMCTTPFDVIKTHKQMEVGELKGAALKQQTRSTFKLLVILCRKQGFASLFTGIGARLAKIAPACAIMISSYEYGKKYYREKNLRTKRQQMYPT